MSKPDQQPIPLPLKDRLLGIQHHPSFRVLTYMLSTRRPVPYNELVMAKQYPPKTERDNYQPGDEVKDSLQDVVYIERWTDDLQTEGLIQGVDSHGFKGFVLPKAVRKQLVVLRDTKQIKNTVPTPPEEVIGANILLQLTGPNKMTFPDLGINSEEDLFRIISTARIYGMRLDFQRRQGRHSKQTLKFSFVNRRLNALQKLLEIQTRTGYQSTFAGKLEIEIGELHQELIKIQIEKGEQFENQPDQSKTSLGVNLDDLPSGYFSNNE